MRISPHLDRVTVVLVGNFNPAIFTPHWFAYYKVVSAVDAEHARVDMIHPEFCRFEIGGLLVQVETQKFSVGCDGARHEMARDLTLTTFGAYLPHTPINAAGINREIHFDSGSFDVRDAVGARLAPRSAWGEWASEIEGAPGPGPGHGGLMRLQMQGHSRHNDIHAAITAEVQPSLLEPIRNSGIYIAVNHHYSLNRAGREENSSEELISIMEKVWDDAIDKSAFIVDQIQSLAGQVRADLGKSQHKGARR